MSVGLDEAPISGKKNRAEKIALFSTVKTPYYRHRLNVKSAINHGTKADVHWGGPPQANRCGQEEGGRKRPFFADVLYGRPQMRFGWLKVFSSEVERIALGE